MGTYVNPGSDRLQMDMNSDFYVDKSLILNGLNKKFKTPYRFMCVSRPRRFGKTTVGNLISAFYSKGADARAIFEKLKIAETDNWDEHLNKFNVIKIDMNTFWDPINPKTTIPSVTKKVLAEMQDEFPGVLTDETSIPEAIDSIFKATRTYFVVIIDEYDVLIREKVPADVLTDYLTLMTKLFKADGASDAIALAYITGIIPIVRDRVGSKLNNFFEYTMLTPLELAPFIGFTNEEVKELCERYGMDYDECLRWYDGYHIAPKVSVCNSNSVCRALTTKRFDDYWTQTGAYTAISDYIEADYEGIREDIAKMVGGGSVELDPGTFLNTLDSIASKDDIFTYLIHLGYLAYCQEDETCHIPNGEVRKEWERALRRTVNYKPVFDMIKGSKELLEATLQCDEQAVADALDKAHSYVTSAKYYNNEGSLQSAVGLAYFSATSKYDIEKEVAGGYGFADIAFKPYVKGAPGMIIELKMDQDPEVGLAQIKEKKYADALGHYRGPVYLVAISYGKESKKHTCKIEVVER